MKSRIAIFIAAIFALWGGIWGLGRPMRPLGAIGGPTAPCPLGWYQPDPNTSQCSTAFGYQPAVAEASTNVFSIQGLTPNDDDFVTVLVKLQTPGATDETGRAWFRYRWGFTFRSDGGAFADPTGSISPTLVDSQVGSGLTGSMASIVQSGSTLIVTVNCQTASSCAASGSVDWMRNSPAPWVLSVSPNTITADAGGTVVITTTPGAAQYATSANLAGFQVGCSQTDDHTATCIVPKVAGYYADGGLMSGGVTLTSSVNPFPMYSGFSFNGGASPPTITLMTPNLFLATGNGGTGSSGQVIKITGTGLVTGTTYDIGSISLGNPTISCTGGTSCTATLPALPVSGSTVGRVITVHTPNGAGSGPSTTTNSGSVSLPQATITVGSTTGFPAGGGLIAVTSANGPQPVLCTGTTPTTFTGCTGGTGAIVNGNAVVQQATAAWVLPTNTNVGMFHRGDVGTTVATGVSTWADQSSAGRNWTQATGANQPALISNYQSTGIPSLQFNGTTSVMSGSVGWGSIPTVTSCVVGNYTAFAQQTSLLVGSSAAYIEHRITAGGALSIDDGTNNISSSVAATSAPHVFCAVANGASSSLNVGSIQNTGTMSPTLGNQGFLGAQSASTFFMTGNIVADLVYTANVSSGDLTTIIQNLAVTSNAQ